MLQEFLITHRAELIDRCRRETVQRETPGTAREATLEHGIPRFLDQTIETLGLEQPSIDAGRARPGTRKAALTELRETAALHGVELERHGFSIGQVVHAYGDLCQAITDLAFELGAPVQVSEFRTLNWCLDNAIADAVTEFYNQREIDSHETTAEGTQELGVLAHEVRNFLHVATLAFDAVRHGNESLSGAHGTTLNNSIIGLRGLVDRTIEDVRLTRGRLEQRKRFSLAAFIDDAATSVQLEARARQCELSVSAVDPVLTVQADRDLLLSALGNLLRNAFKFTRPRTTVTLRAYASEARIFIEVEDRCGGLSASDLEKMFLPFEQLGADRSGLGLGLFICRRSVRESGGILGVRDLPGCGCIFTIRLPLYALPAPAPEALRPLDPVIADGVPDKSAPIRRAPSSHFGSS